MYLFTNLTPNTDYDLYVVAEDAEGNVSAPTKYDVATAP